MGLFDNDDWYERPSLAFGTDADIEATTRVFADVAEAMRRARPAAVRFNDDEPGMWEGVTADMVRGELVDVPEFLRRFDVANGDVAEALQAFVPAFTSYCDEYQRQTSTGRRTHDEMRRVEYQREQAVARLRGGDVGDGDVIGAIGGLLTGYEHDPEVAALTDRLEQLSRDFETARRRFDGNDDEFEAAVERAADRIWDADGVLYNNGWDKFWTQTAAPILEVVKVALEILSVIVMLAAIFVTGGTLAPLILAVALFVVNAAQVAGTAAAGREVTGEMWFSLGMSALAVVTAGAAHWAKGMRAASAANKLEADKLLKARAGFDNASKAAARMENVKSFTAAADKIDDIGRGFEIVEGAGTMVEGGLGMKEGFEEGNMFKVVGGGLSIVAGGYDVGGFDAPTIEMDIDVGDVGDTMERSGNLVGDAAKVGSGTIGAIEGISDLVGGAPDQPGDESPKDWPGLDGMRPQ